MLKGSSYVEHLHDVNQTFKEKNLKPIEILEAESHQSSEDILELVNSGVIKLTVIDNHKARIWAKVLPDIQILDSIAIKSNTSIGWGIRKNNPNAEKERKKLRALLEFFKKYSKQYGFDYLALAAQGYQESQLNQHKKSHRGAVGIMQLLPSTAADKNVGIADISKPEDNIRAGAKYMAFLRDRYFSDPEITPQDQMAFSWSDVFFR